MAESEAQLPARPAKQPQLIPEKIDICRIGGLVAAFLAFLFGIIIMADHPGGFQIYLRGDDAIGFSFYVLAFVLDFYMLGVSIHTRARHRKGNLQYAGKIPPLGLLLFLDTAVMGGAIGWGGIDIAIAGMTPNALRLVFALFLTTCGAFHLKLMVDDCKYIHHERRRKQKEKLVEDFRLHELGGQK